MTSNLDDLRKRNVSARRALTEAFKAPGSIEALSRICVRTANDIAKMDERESLVALGRLDVYQQVERAILGIDEL